jgi:hypothetical protein
MKLPTLFLHDRYEEEINRLRQQLDQVNRLCVLFFLKSMINPVCNPNSTVNIYQVVVVPVMEAEVQKKHAKHKLYDLLYGNEMED